MSDLYIGLMSGTSCDGVDASLIETNGMDHFKPIHNVAISYDPEILSQLQGLFRDSMAFLKLEKKLTEFHIQAVDKLLAESGYEAEQIRAIGFHGQTIFHQPEAGVTWQIGNPHMLAAAIKVDVIHDFRRRDMALGGQGAPLIPIFHKMLAQKQDMPCMIVNIGGVANLTYIDAKELVAFDTGPGNALIDDVMMQHYSKSFDDKGKVAASGKVDKLFVNKVLAEKYYNQAYPKSLDRNSFVFLLKELEGHSSEDIVATLTYLTAATIIHSLRLLPDIPKQIFICGGGVKNKQIIFWMNNLLKEQNIPSVISNISELGELDSDYIESQGFAYLAARFCKGLPSAFPSTTGAKDANICGCIVKP